MKYKIVIIHVPGATLLNPIGYKVTVTSSVFYKSEYTITKWGAKHWANKLVEELKHPKMEFKSKVVDQYYIEGKK